MITRIILITFAAATLLIGMNACHTAHGAGEDIENAGQKIQEKTQ
jgi:predicted small secreted protein